MTTAEELAFTAGLMEGEGTVRINRPTGRNKGHLVVSCVNTDTDLIYWLHERWSGYCRPATGLRSDQRPAMVWVIAARQALSFLEQIEPYCISWRMRERIATARWWQQIKAVPWQRRNEDHSAETFSCAMWMYELNRKGVREACPQSGEWRRS